MIAVRARLDGRGLLTELAVTGHASLDAGPKGGNVVCAAVTGIVRACAEAIAWRQDVSSEGRAEREGAFTLRLIHVPEEAAPWLDGVTRVLLEGVGRIAGDAPGEVVFEVAREGVMHGS